MSKRLKTIIVIDNMCIGGIATSLYNFLHFTSEWLACDLLVFDPDSVDLQRVPENVTILKPPRILRILGMSQKDLARRSRLLFVLRAGLILVSRLVSGQLARAILFAFCRKIQGYDLAISFAQDNGWNSLSKGCNDFVIKKVKAKYRTAFIHCDYANFGGYDHRQENILGKFDSIACVSESCTKNFISKFPALQKQCITCENFTNVSDIRRKAEPAQDYPVDTVSFVTVCRLSTVKGLERTIEAFSELYRSGYHNFLWTIVGDGPEKEKLFDITKQNGLTEKIIFAGEQSNPYPYIKNATVFLLPSLHEAAPMVFGESVALGVPILTTRTCSAVELVQDRNFGLVIENTKDGIKNGIKSILDDPLLIKAIPIKEEQINKMAYRQVEHLVDLAK